MRVDDLPPFLTAKSRVAGALGPDLLRLLEQRRLEPRRGDRRFLRRQSSDNLASGTTGSNLLSSSGESSNHRFLSDASEIPGFRAAVLKVRIHLPLARSPDQPPCIVEFRSKARRPRGTSALLAADCEDTIARHMVGQALLAAQFVPESTSRPGSGGSHNGCYRRRDRRQSGHIRSRASSYSIPRACLQTDRRIAGAPPIRVRSGAAGPVVVGAGQRHRFIDDHRLVCAMPVRCARPPSSRWKPANVGLTCRTASHN